MPEERRGRKRWISAVSWGVATLCLLSCAGWLVAERSYLVDLVVSYQGVLVCGAIVIGLILAALRRFAPAGVVGLSVIVGAWPVVSGRDLSLHAVDLDAPPGPGLVRVVTFNINPESLLWERDLERVMSWHADVVVLIEVPPLLNRGIHRGTLESVAGWNWVHRQWVEGFASPLFVLSRGPLRRLETPGVEHAERDILIALVETDAGPLLIAAAHPQSPRTVERWELGNSIFSRTLPALSAEQNRTGLPLMMAADLNSGPAGSRARAAYTSGLRMSKPLAGGWGSFPSRWPGPVRVQLDDVWLSDGSAGGSNARLRAVAWSSVRSLGSDHRAVVADLRVDQVDR